MSCPCPGKIVKDHCPESFQEESMMQTKELDMLIIHVGMELDMLIIHMGMELDMLIIHVGMELKLHKTLCHFLVAQLQDLEPNVSRKH
jgi:hypothetical protein